MGIYMYMSCSNKELGRGGLHIYTMMGIYMYISCSNEELGRGGLYIYTMMGIYMYISCSNKELGRGGLHIYTMMGIYMYISCSNEELGRGGLYIYTMMNTGVKFGLFKMIFDMYNDEIPIVPKSKLSKMVWSIAWRLDDTFWESTAIMHTKNDLLMKTIGNAQYITWWHLADVVPRIQGMCETMAK